MIVSTPGQPPRLQKVLEGRQPRQMMLMWFQRNRLPVGWPAQRALFASFEVAP